MSAHPRMSALFSGGISVVGLGRRGCSSVLISPVGISSSEYVISNSPLRDIARKVEEVLVLNCSMSFVLMRG